jgi:RimJ/RimL family protein N-acetyltransferase
MMAAGLRKPVLVAGRRLLFRDATPADAEFILHLRTDAQKAAYLSSTPADVALQRDWLHKYAADAGQVYFIVTDLAGQPVGTVRLYDARGDSFCWGSWIKSDGAPAGFGLESALMVYAFARVLGFTRAHFDVRRENAAVRRFHERFGAVQVDADEQDVFYEMSAAAVAAVLERYREQLPEGGVTVTF